MGPSGKVPTVIGSKKFGCSTSPRLILRLGSRLSAAYSSSSDTSLSSSSSSDASSICSSSSSSAGSLSTVKKNNKKKVRFNDNKFFFGGGKSVNCDVQTFEKATAEQDERHELFWMGTELRARRRQEAQLAKGDAEEYLSRAFHVFLQFEKSSSKNSQDVISKTKANSSSSCTSDLVRLAASLDENYRGLERWHGPSGLDRATQREQIVRDVVRMYRRCCCKKKKSNRNSSKQHHQELNEQVRRYANKLNQNTRNLALFYGEVDALWVNSTSDLDDGGCGQQ